MSMFERIRPWGDRPSAGATVRLSREPQPPTIQEPSTVPAPPRGDGGVGRMRTDIDHLADAIEGLAEAIIGLHPKVGRCGHRQVGFADRWLCCALPAGHLGWHRDEVGSEWSGIQEDDGAWQHCPGCHTRWPTATDFVKDHAETGERLRSGESAADQLCTKCATDVAARRKDEHHL